LELKLFFNTLDINQYVAIGRTVSIYQWRWKIARFKSVQTPHAFKYPHYVLLWYTYNQKCPFDNNNTYRYHGPI